MSNFFVFGDIAEPRAFMLTRQGVLDWLLGGSVRRQVFENKLTESQELSPDLILPIEDQIDEGWQSRSENMAGYIPGTSVEYEAYLYFTIKGDTAQLNTLALDQNAPQALTEYLITALARLARYYEAVDYIVLADGLSEQLDRDLMSEWFDPTDDPNRWQIDRGEG